MELRKRPSFSFIANRSLRTRILLIFVVLITIPLTLQGYISYQDFSQVIKRKTANYTMQIADQINKHLDTALMEMQRISVMPLYDAQVIGILKRHGNSGSKTLPTLRDIETMSSYIHGILFNRTEVKAIHIIGNNGVMFTNMDPAVVQLPASYREESWYVRAEAADGANVLIPPHTPYYNLSGTDEQVVSAARLLREPYTNKPIGMIKIDMNLDLFNEILSNLNMQQFGKYIVTNRENELFFQNAMPLDYAKIPALRYDEAASVRQLSIEGEDYFAYSVVSANSGLQVSSFIPEAEMLKDSIALRDFSLAIGGLCLIAACGLALFFSYRLSRPLIELKRKMFRVQMGHFNESLPAETNDEIGQLNSSFNGMVEEIHRLVNEVYVIGMREKEAELAALISRINPHFIYNTLESINMMAVRGGNRDVSDMVTALGTLLRHSVDTYNRLIPLETELESIRSYMQIQRMRYGERLRVVFDVQDGLNTLRIPKLLLQPLVENAIYHGIGDESGTIWIAVAHIESRLLLIVRDDGAGLDETRLAELRESLRAPPTFANEQGRGIALVNIHQRMKLIYGDQADLDIDGQPGEGVSVTLTLPLEGQEEAAHV